MNAQEWLPLFFLFAMALSMLLYVVLDGYDLGVGILFRGASADERERMIATIGPFWDANETWLVLGVGILLIAFPGAHGAILGALYLPVALMLTGLILRGVAFDFRVKAGDGHRAWWDRAFWGGSLLASLAQGFMLGHMITGFRADAWGYGFAVLIAVCLAAGYVLLGATWLVMKTRGELRRRAIDWARTGWWLTGIGVIAVSLATPLASTRIWHKWLALPDAFWLAPIPLASALLFLRIHRVLATLRNDARTRLESLAATGVAADFPRRYRSSQPFVAAVGVFVLAFIGLAYSLYPYLLVDRLTAAEAASSTESLWMIFYGTVIVLPTILAYSAYSYRVFWGKADELRYD
ncbi:MAG: cytochrome d ubiquinol oxidase subunit II [Actinobacteria bacterium]|nr:cytochrome d ubiquinol oxidase subunit II [Xanthomonadales bacterium]MCA0330794.1 cytochrome d ubiquinol oxidase subunit II [Actinomycetota bacterium]